MLTADPTTPDVAVNVARVVTPVILMLSAPKSVAVVNPRVVIPVTLRSSKVFGPAAIAASIVAVVVASREAIF